jgi:hypothetical protein
MPIRLIQRWIDKYTKHHVAALTELKTGLGAEGPGMTARTESGPTTQICRIYIPMAR